MIRVISIVMLILLCSAGYKTRYEKIKSFHSDIAVQTDGSVIVSERIKVLALNDRIKRGIYRDLPLNFQVLDDVRRQDLEVISVKRNGGSESFSTDMIDGGIRIYIGEKEKNISQGFHDYEIVYRLDRTVFKPNETAEIMWNVTGNHWEFLIDTVSATVHTPKGGKVLATNAWTGIRGRKGKNYTSEILNDSTVLFQTKNLSSNEGITVQVGFQGSVLSKTSTGDSFIFFIRDHALILTVIISLIAVFLINFVLWMKYGKDPKAGTIIPQFYPPEKMTPAEVSFMINEGKPDENTFAAQLIQIAVKGYITIEKKLTKSKKDYFLITLTDESKHKETLTEIEEVFLEKLMSGEGYVLLRKKYNPFVHRANNYLNKSIQKKLHGTYYLKNTDLLMFQYLPVALSLLVLVYVYNLYEGSGWLIPVAIIVMIIMNLIFLKLFYAPTVKGRKLLDHIEGFKQFISYADELRINALNKPTMDFDLYEKNLAYAIALGKAEDWGKQFKADDIDRQYRNSGYYIAGYPFYSFGYIAVLSSTFQSASVPPSASGGTSGGGFSAGGGFSGGGAGGGGGGGW